MHIINSPDSIISTIWRYLDAPRTSSSSSSSSQEACSEEIIPFITDIFVETINNSKKSLDTSFVLPKFELKEGVRYRPFFITNEHGENVIFQTLVGTPTVGNTIVAPASFAPLNVAVLPRPGRPITNIVIYDISARSHHFWMQFIPFMQQCPSKEEAFKQTQVLLTKHCNYYYEGIEKLGIANATESLESTLACLKEEIDLGISWLSSDQQFQCIQNIFKNNCFFYRRLDFNSVYQVVDLFRFFKEIKIMPDVFYVSNIFDYLESSQQFLSYKTSLAFVSFYSRIVDAYWSSPKKLMQRMTPIYQAKNLPIPFAPFFKEIISEDNFRKISDLIQSGINIEACDNKGNTMIMHAAWLGATQSVKLFLQAGARLDHINRKGDTILHEAADQEDIIDLLVSAGVPLDAQNEDLATPLGEAVDKNERNKVHALLKYKVNWHIKDSSELTPFMRAQEKPDMMEMFNKAGRKLEDKIC